MIYRVRSLKKLLENITYRPHSKITMCSIDFHWFYDISILSECWCSVLQGITSISVCSLHNMPLKNTSPFILICKYVLIFILCPLFRKFCRKLLKMYKIWHALAKFFTWVTHFSSLTSAAFTVADICFYYIEIQRWSTEMKFIHSTWLMC